MTPIFLSEMSALPLLGGGVTLNKIIGKQITSFSAFIKCYHNPSQVPPNYPSGQSVCLPYPKNLSIFTKLFGCRNSHFFNQSRIIRSLYAKRIGLHSLHALNNILPSSRFLVCPNSEFSLDVFEQIHRRYSNEYITWVMDDHMVRWTRSGWMYTKNIESKFSLHLKNARLVYVISEAMGQFYKEKFGVESHVLFSPCEMVPKPAVLNQEQGRPYRLVYFGSVGRWQNDALEFLLPSLNSGLAEIDIYTRSPELLPESFRALSTCRVCEPIASNSINLKSMEYDAMVLPISFKDELKNMSFFNVATKFSDCIGAPIPTIIIGPKDSIMVKHAREYGAFFVVDKNEPREIEAALAMTRDANECNNLYGGRQLAFDRLCGREIMNSRWKIAADWLFE
jgi:hypothetical protein